MRRVSLALFLFASLLNHSCAPSDEAFSLAEDEDEAWAARRARMNVTVRVETPMGVVEREFTPAEFRATLRAECVQVRDSGVPAAAHLGCDNEDYSGPETVRSEHC